MPAFDGLPDLLLREEWRPLPDPRPQDPLAAAAAALGAGEARRAIGLLDGTAFAAGDETAVATALRHVAGMLDGNWFPGGTAVTDPDRPPDIAQPDLPAETPEAALVVVLARRLLAAAPMRRSIVESALGAGDVAVLLRELGEVEALVVEAPPRMAGPAALLLADLWARIGRPTDALDRARAAYGPGDAIGQAVCALAAADAQLPGGRPETLGAVLVSGPMPVADPGEPPDGLDDAYRAVADGFAEAGAGRGVAAVALRRSRLALAAGDADSARALLGNVDAAGDTALARLIAIHAALLEVELDGDLDAAAVAAPVVDWARTIGSRSFVRGLARLCVAWSRGRDAGPAQRVLILAGELADGLGAGPESDLVRRAWVDLYGAVNLRRASMAVSLSVLTEHEASVEGPPPAGGDIEWVRLVEQAAYAYQQGATLGDPDALARADHALTWIARRLPPDPTQPGQVEVAADAVAGMRADVAVFEPMHRARRIREVGRPESAEVAFRQAEEAADAVPPGWSRVVAQAVVRGYQRRYAEAEDVVDAGVADGSVSPEAAPELYVRAAHQFAKADERLAGLPPPEPPSWADAALRAEVALGLGRLDAAADESARARRLFEDRLAGLANDLLRSSALDAPPVAGLYTTAVRVHAARTAHRPGLTDDLDTAFRLSDRARGMTLADILDAERDATTQDERGAVRTWQRAGAELALTIEDVAARPDRPDRIRDRLFAAQRALTDAEERLRRSARALFDDRTRLPEQPSAAQVQERLPPGTLLVQYHAFDDQLVTFALSRDSAIVRVADAITAQLSGDVWRYHRAVRSPQSSPAELAVGAELATTLLGPIADELAAHDHVIVVPYGTLAILPFHALPFAGGVLADGCVVSYLPAVSAVLGRPSTPVADGPALVVGGLDYDLDSGLPDLPGTRLEVRRVADLHGVVPLVDRQADRASVLERLGAARLVHLATHGELVDGAPYSAHLALSGGDRLTVPDLVGLGLRTELAVLSACDSGRGSPTATGDVIGLTRALLGSGVRGLVVSLWPVDDAYATLLMTMFHEHLVAPVPPAVALATAALELRDLTHAEAVARYVALGGDPRVMNGRRGPARGPQPETSPDGAGGEDPVGPEHPSRWAPFVYVGPPKEQ